MGGRRERKETDGEGARQGDWGRGQRWGERERNEARRVPRWRGSEIVKDISESGKQIERESEISRER